MNSEKNRNREFIIRALQLRKEKEQFRSLTSVEPVFGTSRVICKGKELINFCSNDYLGLSSHPKVIERSREYLEQYGTGSGASRLVSGTLSIHNELEEKLAEMFQNEAVLLFNSGFQANVSVIPALADRNSLILMDKNCHNSLIQGATLSRAMVRRFQHNDVNHLEKHLQKSESESFNRILIVSETVFSMDGDRNNLKRLISLSEQFGAMLYSDDAHALGVLGKKGLGLNFQKPIDINLGAFGKGFGGFGAFVGCSKEMKEYLINFSSGFIYSTALPPAAIGALDAALELIPEMDDERKKLHKKVHFFKDELHQLGYNTGTSDSQIVPILIGSEQQAIELSKKLEKNGLWVSAIRPPTVEQGASRLRITITAKHSYSEIDQLLSVLGEWKIR